MKISTYLILSLFWLVIIATIGIVIISAISQSYQSEMYFGSEMYPLFTGLSALFAIISFAPLILTVVYYYAFFKDNEPRERHACPQCGRIIYWKSLYCIRCMRYQDRYEAKGEV